jgi:3'-5' exoribonuclease
MKHIFISDLNSGTRIESVYLVRDVMKKSKKSGEPYVFLNLQDSSDIINAVMWEGADLFLSNQVKQGDFVLVNAGVGLYNKQLQLTIRDARKVDPTMLDLEKFLPASKRPLIDMLKELRSWIDRVKRPYLKALLDSFFGDDKYLKTFLRAPSARTMHQAYIGGLVEHTLGVVKNAITVADNYGGVDKELLITGALLHDGAKIYEYSFDTAISITDRGRLIGHLAMMAMELESRISGIEEFPEEERMLLEHMILAHHGRQEWGSPKLPQTAEALILFYSDYMDAYLSTFFESQRKAHEKGEKWTGWVDMFGGFLYAGELPPEVAPE